MLRFSPFAWTITLLYHVTYSRVRLRSPFFLSMTHTVLY